MNKRGISPIFATVLLIAFAVAIGAMIMNWSAGVSLGPSCDNTEIKASEGGICLVGNVIKFSIRNTGKEAISDLLVGSEKTLTNIDLPPDQAINGQADFSESMSKRGVRVIPVIKTEEEVYQCEDKSIVLDKIESCS